MRRSQSHSAKIHTTSVDKSTTLGRKMSFNRSSLTRASFSKKNQPSLIGSQDFLSNGHSTFEMTLTERNSEYIVNHLYQYKRYPLLIDDVKVAVTSKPILLKDFAAHVAEMHKNSDHGFEVEYGVCS